MQNTRTVCLFRLTGQEEKSLIRPIAKYNREVPETIAKDKKLCARCNTENDADAVFCKACANFFGESGTVSYFTPPPSPAKVGSYPSSAAVAVVQDSADALAQEQKASAKSRKKTRKGFIAAGCAAIVIFSIFIGVKAVQKAFYDKKTENAKAIENACKNYYVTIVSGAINNDNDAGVTADTMPDKGSSISSRKTAALKATVAGALEYSGLTDLKDYISEYDYYITGTPNDNDYDYQEITIYYCGDPYLPISARNLTLYTTLGELMGA